MSPGGTRRHAVREALINSGTVQSIGPRLVCALLLAVVCVLTGTQPAQAAPQDITRAQTQAATLEAQLKELTAQAQLLREQYESAATQLAQTQTEAAENASLLAQAQEDQANAENALNDRLAEIYKQGRGGTLDLLLSSSSWSDLLERMTLLERISKQDTDLVRQVTAFRAQVADRETKLAAQLEKQGAAAKQVETASQAVTQKLERTKQLLKGKEAEIARLQRAWQAQLAKQAQLEKERQARLQAALAAAQVAAQKKKPAPTSPPTTTRPDSGQVHNRGSNILKPEQIALVAQKAGFSGEGLVISVAVAMAESHSDANAIGRHTYGLWQILSYAHPDMINPRNPDASRWYDPYVNARFAWKISGHGTWWRPWGVYTSGSYLRNMARARAGVELLLTNPSAVVPPTAK
jgi:peptidoglycan hydrolase CwlO-like protein